MPQFVVLHHDWPQPHYDFMVEREGVLWTWRWGHLPCLGEEFTAERIADHRIIYLDYEGPVSGDRGVVTRHDRGSCEVLSIDAKQLTLVLSGEKIRGQMVIDEPDAAVCRCRFLASPSSDGSTG